MYFLLDGLLDRLVYLPYGLGLILGFIGVKLLLHALHENNLPFINDGENVPVVEIPTTLSLLVIVVILAITVVVSLVSPKGKALRALQNASATRSATRGPWRIRRSPTSTASRPPTSWTCGPGRPRRSPPKFREELLEHKDVSTSSAPRARRSGARARGLRRSVRADRSSAADRVTPARGLVAVRRPS